MVDPIRKIFVINSFLIWQHSFHPPQRENKSAYQECHTALMITIKQNKKMFTFRIWRNNYIKNKYIVPTYRHPETEPLQGQSNDKESRR